MKKFAMGFLLICVIFCGGIVKAEAYYVNDNGLEFTKFQYRVMVEILDEEKVRTMTKEKYDLFEVAKKNENNTSYSIYEEGTNTDGIMPFAEVHQTASKRLSIIRHCDSNYCSITLDLNWFVVPKVKSYDVIGVRTDGPTVLTNVSTTILSIDGTEYDIKGDRGFSNGYGAAVKLVDGKDYEILQIVKTTAKSGKVYGSYQHAVKSISLSNALNFSVGTSGLGGVFVYSSTYKAYYDAMGGVSISI